MDNVLRRIIALCAFKGVDQKELTSAIGLKGSSMTEWKAGRSKSYNKHLPQIASFLNVSVSQLLGEEAFTSESVAKRTVAEAKNIIAVPETKKVPLLGTIACGKPILAVENIMDFVSVPTHIAADMALVCKGDSMVDARIYDGDIVYLRQQEEVENGEIAAILIGDEATLKRVYIRGDRVILSPCNPAYEHMVFVGAETAEIRIIGKAVAFTSAVR